MLRSIILASIFLTSAACSSESFLGATDSRVEKKDPESEDEDLQASEPVPIGGAFLNCQLFESEQNQLKCRIEEDDDKMSISSELKASDLIAYDEKMQIMPKDFMLAPADSKWHWMSKANENLESVYMLGLASRFQSDEGPSNTMTTMPPVEKIVKEEIPENFDLVPGPDDMVLVGEDSFEALGVTWVHGASGESCIQACDDVGKAFLEPIQKWTKEISFCQNAFNRLYPGQLEMGAVSFGAPGLGCYTMDQLPNTVAINDLSIERGIEQAMPGVRQFCACSQD